MISFTDDFKIFIPKSAMCSRDVKIQIFNEVTFGIGDVLDHVLHFTLCYIEGYTSYGLFQSLL